MKTHGSAHALLLKARAAAGVSPDGAELIRIGENAVWRLRNKVVVRIAHPGRRRVAARELAVTRWLRNNDFPAVRPLDAIPGPVDADGHPATFWHELPPHQPGTGADLAPLLHRLHQLPVPEIDLESIDPFLHLSGRIERAVTLNNQQQQWLYERLSELEEAWSALPAGRPTSVIHGDAWGGNVAVAADCAYLLDFERAALGPPEWDLIPLAVGHDTFGTVSQAHYAAFCAAYGADVTTWSDYPVLRGIRELHVTCFALQHAAADPDRYREQAHHRVECLQGRHGRPRPWRWTAI